MATEGTPAFNGIALLEVEEIDWRAGAPALVGHAAFVDTRTGKTYGSTTIRVGWSRRTTDLLEELRVSMEQDVASIVFVNDTPSALAARPNEEPGGIGEDLGRDVPQI